MKRVLSLFLSCIFVLGVCFSTPIVASAASVNDVFGTTTQYKILSLEDGGTSGTCALIKYAGTGPNVTISGSATNEDVSYTITQISAGAFSGNSTVETITISETVTTIDDGAFAGCSALTAFALTGEDNSFYVSDGVLFNEAGTKLVAYPAGKTDVTSYAIPADVTEIANGAFSGCKSLETITVAAENTVFSATEDGVLFNANKTKLVAYPSGKIAETYTIPTTVTEIADGAFSGCKSLKTITVAEGNTAFSATEDGVLFNQEGTKLIAYPAAKTGTEYTIPEGVEEIATGAFADCVNLKYIFTEKTSFEENEEITIGENNNIFSQQGVYHEGMTDHSYSDVDGSKKCTVCEFVCEHTWENGACTECGLVCEHTGVTCGEEGSCTTCRATYTASHEWTFAKPEDQNVITATCENCLDFPNGVTLTLNKPAIPEGATALVYDDNPKEAAVTVSAENTGIEPVVEYKSNTDGVELVDGKCVNAGNYTASITLGNETVSVEFTIAKATATVTAPTAKTDLVYSGVAQELVTPGSANGGTIYYTMTSGVDNSWSTEIPEGTNAGEYTVYYKVVGDDNHNNLESENYKIDVTIAKATATVTAPTAKTDLVYNGEKQELVVAGTIGKDQGEIQYRLGEDGEWSTEIPKGTNAGDYTVYYQFVADDNHECDENPSNKGSVEVTIEQMEIDVAYPIEDDDVIIYNGTPQQVLIIFTIKNDPSRVLALDENEDYNVKYTRDGKETKDFTSAGKIDALVTLNDNGNFKVFTEDDSLIYTKELSYIIQRKTLSEENVEKIPDQVYTGEKITPIVTVKDGETTLTLGTDYTVKYSNNTDFGTATVIVTFIGNYSGMVEKTFEITKDIAKVTNAPTAKTDLVYDGAEKELVTPGSANGGTIYYTITPDVDNSWSTEIPKETNADTYTVYYKVIGDENHSDSAEASISVTIGKAPVTISVETQERVYDGTNAVKIKSATVSDVVSGEEISVKFYGVTATSIDGTGVGTHTVGFKGDFELVGETAGNYEIGAVSGATVTITAKPLTITAKDATVVVNSVMPKFEYTIEGLVDSDSIANVEFVATVENSSTVVENTATVGTYVITPSGAVIEKGDTDVTKNYEITYKTGVFTVTACTKHEWKNSKCEICKIDCEHKYEDGKSAISNKATTQATCVKEGVLLTQCKICDYKAESPLDIVSDAHKMSDWKETVKATCSSTGTEERVCELGCGHKETRPTEKDPDNHTYGDWVITAATCVADGVKVKTCKNKECKHELKETIAKDPTAHKMAAEWEVTKKPTCVETGLQVKACLNAGCDHEVEEVIAIKADAHNLGGWVVTKAAKCTIPGEITRFCKNGSCEYKVTDSLDPDGKNHDFAEDFTVIESTCVAKGSKFKVCENEGCKVVTEKTEIAINPAAHKNIVTINAKEATCEEKGYTGDKFCNDCKKTVDPGIEINAKGHTESDWIVDKEATFTEEGARHTACTVCKKELKKEVIVKLTLATPSPKAYNKTGCIKVKWADVDNALTYNVYRSEYVNKKWTTWKRIASGVKQGVGYYNDKNVTEGKQYKYTVKAYNGDFVSGKKASNKLIFISPVKPSLTTTTTGIILKWNTVLGADKYIAYRSQIVDGKWSDWKKVVTITDGKSSWVDTTAESGVTYKYSVRVYKGSSYSNREASTSIIFLTQPTLKLSNTSTGIKGSWKTVNGATGYVVTRAEYNDSLKKYGPTVKIGTASGTAKSFTDKTAKAGVKYKYTVTAINGSYSSIVSPAKSYRRLAQPTVTIENTNGAIKGSWTQVTGAASYIIYRSEVVNGKWSSWKNLGTAGATAKSFTDKTVKSGVKYKYRVIAKNGGSKSSAEASNKLVYLTCPKATVSNSIYGAKVKWNVITGAESYIVYRKSYVNKQWTAWQQIAKTSTNSYTDSTAVSGAKYRYTIHAVNDGSLSARKDSASFVYVEAPKTTTTVKAKAITLNWNEIGGAKKYVVYRAELGDDGKWSGWSKVASLKDVNTFADTTVVAGKTYKYKVNACIGKSKSSSNATSGVLVPKAQ